MSGINSGILYNAHPLTSEQIAALEKKVLETGETVVYLDENSELCFAACASQDIIKKLAWNNAYELTTENGLFTKKVYAKTGLDSFILKDVFQKKDLNQIWDHYLPSGYTKSDHIEVTGTQYIDTPFIPNQDTRIVCEYKYLGGVGIYGARNKVSSDNFSLRVINDAWQLGYGDGVTTGTIVADNNWHIADQNKNTLYIDGELAATREYTQFTPKFPVAIGAIHGGSIYYGKGCYRTFKIYDNDVLVHYYISCSNPSGEVGMYDLITSTFIGLTYEAQAANLIDDN